MGLGKISLGKNYDPLDIAAHKQGLPNKTLDV